MKEDKCYRLIQHFSGPNEWENIIAVSHDLSKLQKALKTFRSLKKYKSWKVLTDKQAMRPELQNGSYFSITSVNYL